MAADRHREVFGEYPEWVFDFISIHDKGHGWQLLAPLCMLGPNNRRPRWERIKFNTLGEAVRDAKRLAEIYGDALSRRIHVVNCH
jgi:hypothetical protein